MSELPLNQGANVADQDKAHTPDKLRNDNAKWKDKDMSEAEHTAKPEDYERPQSPKGGANPVQSRRDLWP